MEYAKEEILNVRFREEAGERKSGFLKKIFNHKFLFCLSIFGLVTLIWYIGLICEFIYVLQHLGN